jgi:hypothetical protein
MSPRHFSKYGGPYFINDGVSKHNESNKVSVIGSIKSFFVSRRKKRQGDK